LGNLQVQDWQEFLTIVGVALISGTGFLPTLTVSWVLARLMRNPPRIPRVLPLIFLGLLAWPMGAGAAAGGAPAWQNETCAGVFEPVGLPLTELGSQPYRRMDGQETTFTGGLYPGGSNARPPAHEAAALAAAGQIQPLNAQGSPDPAQGRVVMVSIGMSNANIEFQAFMDQAAARPNLNPRLILINGALPSQTADRWVDPAAPAWQALDQQLAARQISPAQVQAAWVKNTLTGGGAFPDQALELQAALEAAVRNLKARFPNLRIAYVSSRIRSYTYFRGLSPEPLAFESGFAVKWMIEKQINGDPGLNYDPARGAVTAPVLLWGPYLWADGQNPRADGLVWLSADLTSDCTHPSAQGRQKAADLLMDFFQSDSTTRGWFLAGAPGATPTSTPPPSSTLTPTALSSPTAAPSASRTPTVTRTPGRPAPSLTPTPPGGPNDGEPAPIYFILVLGAVLALGVGIRYILPRK